MRIFYYLILTIFMVIFVSCKSQPKKMLTIEELYPFPIFDPLSASPTPIIEKGCETPQLDLTITQEPRPEFPAPSIRAGITGYAIFDFNINSQGRAINAELVATNSKNFFEKNSRTALSKLIFAVSNRNNACLNQKYRVGYAFRIMTKCKGNEFPSDITGICTTAYIYKTLEELNKLNKN